MINYTCLDVGGGYIKQPGRVNVDLFYPDADVRAAAWALPHKDETVQELHCSHMLEHLEKRMVLPTCKEFYRVLQQNGLLVLEVPDLAWCCQNWIENQDSEESLNALFGHQKGKGQVHQTGFNLKILTTYLKQANFDMNKLESITTPMTYQMQCLHIEVRK